MGHSLLHRSPSYDSLSGYRIRPMSAFPYSYSLITLNMVGVLVECMHMEEVLWGRPEKQAPGRDPPPWGFRDTWAQCSEATENAVDAF